MRPLPLVLALAAALPLAAGGCGDETASGDQRPVVYAASSLRDAFPDLSTAARYSFAGSDKLRLQIERGAPADVFASANPKEAQALRRAGRCSTPRTFTTNVLVLLVPARAGGRVRSVQDLRRGGLRLAVGSEGVPIGDYTRKLLARMRLSSALARNTVSSEPDVAGIVGKVALGSADAGFAYATDARSATGRVRAIALPREAQPPVRLQICAVHDTPAAQRFVDRVLSPAGRAILRRHGFG